MATASLNDYLSAERTLLAWIRTGLALMGFGFVVSRFGLFLQQLEIVEHGVPVRSGALSLWFGTGLIAVGVMVNLLSAWHHHRLMNQLTSGGVDKPHLSSLAVGVSIFLALIGLGMVIYLVTVRSPQNANPGISKETSMASPTDNGIVTKPSGHSVEQTVQKLKDILQQKGVTLFALVDHSGEAEKVGMKMNPTKLLIFGNPKAGTPLMQAAPSTALDLPLKILVWEDAEGRVWLSYNSAQYLQKRHGFPEALMQNVAVAEGLALAAGQ